MFASVTCPACKHKFTIPEGQMGSRLTCPNCQSPFLAGKSVPEKVAANKVADSADVPMRYEPAAPAGINKTMLGETEPPVRYNCPRCKKPLESPASEAGMKKPCPACGQRLQVPAPPPSAAQPNLNKTMLTSADGSAAPVQPSAPAAAATLPAGQIVPAPARSNARMFGIIGAAVGGLAIVLLLTCILGAVIRNNGRDDQAAFAKEIERLKAEIEQRKQELDRQRDSEAAQQKKWDGLMADMRTRQEALDRQRAEDARNQLYLDNKKLADEAKAKREQDQRELDRQKKESEDKLNLMMAELKASRDATAKALEAANQKQAVIINQPPPPPVYWYHPRYYWGW